MAALADFVKGNLANFKATFSSRCPYVTAYLNLICSYAVEELLVWSVEEMRQAVRACEAYLPQGAFYSKRDPNLEELEFKRANQELLKVFDYDWFARPKTGWSLGELALELSKVVRVCPYCNAETVYAYKVSGGKFKIVKSSFDHYFPQARYPFLALSLYNLIPACSRCNTSFKGDKYEGLLEMAHPYASDEGIHDGMKYRLLFKDAKAISNCQAEGLEGVLLTERGVIGSFEKGIRQERLFKTSETYTALYRPVAADALWKSLRYSSAYLDLMAKKLKRSGMTRDRLERLMCGASLDAKDINLNCHGKMIQDIYETYSSVVGYVDE